MFPLFAADTLLSVVHVLLLSCLGQAGEETGSSTAPLKAYTGPFNSSCRGMLLGLDVFLCKKPVSLFQSVFSWV